MFRTLLYGFGKISMLCLHSDARAELALAAALAVSQAGSALAHGFAGDRFFPATILTDDPYVADEMSLPTVTVFPPASDGAQQINISPSRRPINGSASSRRASRRSAASGAPSARSFNINSS